MNHRLVEYLRQIRASAQDSIDFMDGMSLPRFQEDLKTQRAVTMNLVLLGESAAKIGEHFPDFVEAHSEIPWTEIRGMRNRIAHEYFILNFETIWSTVTSELPSLVKVIAAIAEQQP